MILFVVNEKAGNGRGKKVWRKVEEQLRGRNMPYEKIAANTQAEAVAHAENMMKSKNLKAVAVVGGDGTLHGMLPLLAGSGIPVGLIPSGSGNDTARTLRIPPDPLAALDIILAGQTRACDVLETTAADGVPRLTLTAVASGLDGAVAADVNGSRYKKWCNALGIGSLSYVIGFVRTLFVFKPAEITLTIDGARHRFAKAWLAAVANTPSYGGGLKICPDARIDDGSMQVCVVHSCGALRILRVFPTLLNGSHVRQPYVTMLTGRSLTIEAPSRFAAFGDGELCGHAPFKARVLPAQLLFLTIASG